jgi:hypothetical protein
MPTRKSLAKPIRSASQINRHSSVGATTKNFDPARISPAVQWSIGSLRLSRKCAACEEEEKYAKLARKESSTPSATPAIPPIVHEVLRSPGVPLDNASRASMELRFGRSFADVRIHADSTAAESARSVNALAYTVGSHIVFSANQSLREHPKLLAHELAHIEQQRSAASAVPREISERGAPEEVEADRIAESVMSDPQWQQPVQLSGPRLSRWVNCDSTAFSGMRLEPPCPPREPGEIARSRTGLSVGSITAPEVGEIVFGFAVGSSNASGLASDPAWRAFSYSIASSSTDRWEIIGFTDCEGPGSLNTDLRQDRATKVFAQLPAAARSRIDRAVGAPKADCVAANDTESNRKFNRSVVFLRTSSKITFPQETITGIQCPPTTAITASNLADFIALMKCAETQMGLSPREMLPSSVKSTTAGPGATRRQAFGIV